MNRLIGQAESLKNKMANNDNNCVQNIQQLKAIISGLKQVGNLYMVDHIDQCLQGVDDEEMSDNLKKVTNTLFSL